MLAFVMAAGSLLAGVHQRVAMDTLGRVFMTGGAVPPFAVGGKRFGESVSGGSPNPSLQPLAVALLDARIEGGSVLTFEWPGVGAARAECAGRPSLAPGDLSAMSDHGYRLRAESFLELHARWGPHSIDRCDC